MSVLVEKLLLTGGVPLVMLVIGWFVGRYVKPWVHKTEARLAVAQEIALVADRLTDELVYAMPGAKWDDILNTLIDRLIKSLGLKPEIAKREAIHKLQKKLPKPKN